MDPGTKAEMLAAVASFMKQRGSVIYDSHQYHNIENLKVDLDAACKTEDIAVVEHLVV